MTEYVVVRKGAWLTEEELDADWDCLPAVRARFTAHVRLLHSFIFREPDGTFSAHCYYEAESPEWILKLSEAAMLPCDSIKPVMPAYTL